MSKKGWGKMKKILIMVVCLLAGSVAAQELFPELAGLGGRTKQVEKKAVAEPKPAPVVAETKQEALPEIGGESLSAEDGVLTAEDMGTATEETVTEEVDLFAAPAPQEEAKEEEADEEEEDEEEDQKITIYMQDADATITPNRDFSYCFGILKVTSTMKKPVEALDVVLKYGGLTSNYNIRNLVPKDEQTGTISLMGEACEHILDMPEITIKTCRVPEMSEAKCKKKVEFLPLRGE